MPPTYPLTMPDSIPSAAAPSMTFAVSQSSSPFTFQEQAYKWGGERWAIDFNFPPMLRAEAEEWLAFMLELRGSFGTFLAGDPAGYAPRGVGTGTPLVKGAGQTGYSLITDGWTPSTTGILLKGDYFSLGTGLTTRLYKLTQDANSNGSGEATLEFVTAISSAPADNAPLTINDAKGLFRMESPVVQWNVSVGMEYGIQFRAVSKP